MPKTTAPKPIPDSTRPRTSKPPAPLVSPAVFGTQRSARTKSTTAMGTLTQKIASQPANCVSTPPRSGPTAAAPDMTAPHMPNAVARSLSRNSAFTLDSVDGRMHAPPMPWMTRAMTNGANEVESAATMEPTVKITRPTRKRVRRPKRSPARPEVSSNAAKTTE